MSNIRRTNYSLIELTLAMVVLTAAVAAALVLLASGSAAGAAASSENHIADAAEYVAGYYSSVISNDILAAQHEANVAGTAVAADRTFAAWKSKLDASFADSDLENRDWESTRIPGTLLTAKTDANLWLRVFKFEHVVKVDGIDTVEFAALVRIWAEDMPLSVRNWSAPGAPVKVYAADESELVERNYALRLMMELSWPLAKPYQEREKRVYVMDMCNPVKELQ